jgi:hypothetical protein
VNAVQFMLSAIASVAHVNHLKMFANPLSTHSAARRRAKLKGKRRAALLVAATQVVEDDVPARKRYKSASRTVLGMTTGVFILWLYLVLSEHLQLLRQPYVSPRSEWVCSRTCDFYTDMQQCWPNYAAETETRGASTAVRQKW